MKKKTGGVEERDRVKQKSGQRVRTEERKTKDGGGEQGGVEER